MSLANLFNGGGILTQDSECSLKSSESVASLSQSMQSNNLNTDMMSCDNEMGKENRTSNAKRKACRSPNGSPMRDSIGLAPSQLMNSSYGPNNPSAGIYFPNYHPSYPIGFSSPRKKSRKNHSTPKNSPISIYKSPESKDLATVGGNVNAEITQTTPQKVASILASELPLSRRENQQSRVYPPPPAHGVSAYSAAARVAISHADGMKQLMEVRFNNFHTNVRRKKDTNSYSNKIFTFICLL